MSAPSSDERPAHYDEQLNVSYTSAEYVFHEFVLKIGQHHPDFDDWLTEQGYRKYAFLTAFNPRSVLYSPADNTERQESLHQLLRVGGLPFAPAAGRDPEGNWPTEIGVFLFDVPSGEVHELARVFGQNAVVEGKVAGVPFLVWV
ncbi:DUF3293 domain-containing protein [Neolewinella persica]|uniref:DUF3293 domain-containing protein n=1 Tax=Neolewinella persica TaxID=70998 RepID=UPI00035ED87B|nr:DUF3293 domain-containing protein [Neolewinella persica]